MLRMTNQFNSGILLFFTVSPDCDMVEIEKALSAVSIRCKHDANIVFGLDFDDSMTDEIKAFLISTVKV